MPPELPAELLLTRELARKLAWAIRSTFSTPKSKEKHLRALCYRLASNMVAAKRQFHPKYRENTLDGVAPPPDNGRAGGGADGGISPRKRLIEEPPSARPMSGEGDAAHGYYGFIGRFTCAPWSPETGPRCIRFREGQTRCSRRDCWRGRINGVWGSASHNKWWGPADLYWHTATPAPPCVDRG